MKIKVWTESYKGKKEENEDAIFKNKEFGIFVIADGMTGYQGKYASQTAVEFVGQSIRDQLKHPDPDSERDKFLFYLKAIMERANEKLLTYALAQKSENTAGTTLDVVVLKDKSFYFAHIGDSRIYAKTKNNKIVQLTRDQTTVQQLINEGKITSERAKVHPEYFQLKHFLGNDEFSQNHIITGSVSQPQKIVMITDGLSDIASDTELESLFSSNYGEKIIKSSMCLYRNPDVVSAFYFKYNSKFALNLLSDLKEDIYSDLHYKIKKEGKPHEFLVEYLEKNEKVKNELLKKASEILSERDNFSIIVIEPQKKFKFWGE